jgi:hypothetical protein
MKPEIIAAIVADGAAVISAMISLYGQARSTYLADRLAKQRKAQTTALMSKYRVRYCDRQSRLFNIHQNASSLMSDLISAPYKERAQREGAFCPSTLFILINCPEYCLI